MVVEKQLQEVKQIYCPHFDGQEIKQVSLWFDNFYLTIFVTRSHLFGLYSGVVDFIEITFLGNCQHVTWELSVMRCSNEPNDFIYRYDDDKMQCYNAFCGMM